MEIQQLEERVENLEMKLSFQDDTIEQLNNAIILMKLNVDLYPDSANTYDSYAELLIKDKQYNAAQPIIQKGLSIAKKTNNKALTKSLTRLLNRLPKF